MFDEALETRPGLPTHLRVLVERFPRESWQSRAGALTRFWLDRHLMFREAGARIADDAAAFLQADIDAPDFAARLSRLAGFLVNQLHEHHHVEDAHYFPLLARREPRLIRGFQILDADHHALDMRLSGFVDDANAVLRAIRAGEPGRDEAGRFRDRLERFAPVLDRHLIDEEEIVIPILIAHGE